MPYIVDPKTGKLRKYSNDYMIVDDLAGQDWPCTIRLWESKEATFDKGRKQKGIHVYVTPLPPGLEGVDKPLVLNVTNALALKALYGATAKVWIGKPITLHPDVTEVAGKMVDCIRITAPKAKTQTVGGPK